MDESFRKEYLCEPALDLEFEAFLAAWEIYHRTADMYDGDIRSPRTPDEYKRVRHAAREGKLAQERYLTRVGGCGVPDLSNSETLKKWNRAKLEALRRLECHPSRAIQNRGI